MSQIQKLYKMDVSIMSDSEIKDYLKTIQKYNSPFPKDAVNLNIHFPIIDGPLYEYAKICNRRANKLIQQTGGTPTIFFGQDMIPHITVAMMAIKKNKITELITYIRNFHFKPIKIIKWSEPIIKGQYIMIWNINDEGNINRFLTHIFTDLKEFIHPYAYQYYPPWLKFNALQIIKNKISSIREMGSPNIYNFEPHLTIAHSTKPIELFPSPICKIPQLLNVLDIRRARINNGSVIPNSLPTRIFDQNKNEYRQLSIDQQLAQHLRIGSDEYEE